MIESTTERESERAKGAKQVCDGPLLCVWRCWLTAAGGGRSRHPPPPTVPLSWIRGASVRWRCPTPSAWRVQKHQGAEAERRCARAPPHTCRGPQRRRADTLGHIGHDPRTQPRAPGRHTVPPHIRCAASQAVRSLLGGRRLSCGQERGYDWAIQTHLTPRTPADSWRGGGGPASPPGCDLTCVRPPARRRCGTGPTP